MKRDNEFELTTWIIADLKQAYCLSNSSNDPITFFKLLMGLFSPRFLPVLLCRLAHQFYCWRIKPLAKFIALINFMLFGIEIAVQSRIGKGLFFPHTSGTVIGAYAIGENAIIFQGVTLGARELDFTFSESFRPVLGDNVTVGSGAKVLGGINIGHDARVGANAVVLNNIPDKAFAAGVPAKIIQSL